MRRDVAFDETGRTGSTKGLHGDLQHDGDSSRSGSGKPKATPTATPRSTRTLTPSLSGDGCQRGRSKQAPMTPHVQAAVDAPMLVTDALAEGEDASSDEIQEVGILPIPVTCPAAMVGHGRSDRKRSNHEGRREGQDALDGAGPVATAQDSQGGIEP